MLTLPIKKKWFDLIASGEKREEYRDATPYYLTRLEKSKPAHILLRNGYSKKSPTLLVKVDRVGMRGFSLNPHWGEPVTLHYVIKFSDVRRITYRRGKND